MPSTASPSILAELQAGGENLNTWGDTRLNNALSMLEAAGHGLTQHTLTANKALTYSNFVKTDGTDYVHKITAASNGSYTLTLAGLERAYLIWNSSTFDQVIACSGGGASVTLKSGEVVQIYCDAVNVVRENARTVDGDLTMGGNIAMNGFKVTGAGAPVANADLTTKQYVDGLALAQSNLPGQTAATRFASITSDGAVASWQQYVFPQTITSNTTAIARIQPYLCDTSAGPITLTLPASPVEGDIVRFIVGQDARTNALTIGRNGETIGGLAEDMLVRLAGFSGVLIYTSGNWKVYAQ